MIYEVTGKVIALPPMQTGMGQNGPWARQTVVLEYTESANDGRIFNYQMALESSKQAEEMSRLRLGDVIKCRFKVTSREYNGKYYTSAQVIGYNLENGQTYAAPPAAAAAPVTAAPAPAPAAPAPAPVASPAPPSTAAGAPAAGGEGTDDLPF